MIHEMGHMFGLIHTHGSTGYTGLSFNQWECKNGTNSSEAGDKIEDTPADPFAMDVDGDSETDHFKWVNNCVQSIDLLNSFTGRCQGGFCFHGKECIPQFNALGSDSYSLPKSPQIGRNAGA